MATTAKKKPAPIAAPAPAAPPPPPAVINMSAKPKAKSKSKIPVAEGVIDVATIDGCYAEKVTLDNADAAFKASSSAVKAFASEYMGGAPGTVNFPGTEVCAQVCVKRDSLGVSDPAKAKAVAGPRFGRYIDEQVMGVVYAVSALDKAKVVAALQAAGIDPNTVLRETVQAKYEVREQYSADLADGTLDAIFGDQAEAFKACIEVSRAGSVSIKFVNRSED